jgi:hypothetical protein
MNVGNTMILLLLLLLVATASPFQRNVFYSRLLRPAAVSVGSDKATLALQMTIDRRDMLGLATLASIVFTTSPQHTNAQVFLDPAMYGDQELRVGAVDTVRECVRRAILQKPQLAPSFYQLAMLDGLSFKADTNEYGPDGSIIKSVLLSKSTDSYMQNLQSAAYALIDAEKALVKKTAITLADAVAIGGAEAIESIGGPILAVQLGRADASRSAPIPDHVPIDLLSGTRSTSDVVNAFKAAGLTEREMTALLSGLMTLEIVEKTRTTEDWKQATRPKFREAGKIGRMSEFKRLTDEDIAEAEAQAALESDPDYEDPDEGWYIADSFGTRETRFGARIAKDDISEKNFNKYLQELNDAMKPKKGKGITPQAAADQFGWIAGVLLDPALPTCQTWLTKYASSNLNFLKDLPASFYTMTLLGAVYTGGKYESLLKNKPRKSLNNDELNLGF